MKFLALLFFEILFLFVETGFAADKVRIGYSGATVSNAMLWVTDEGKLFQKNGIDPQILYLQTTLGQTAMDEKEIDDTYQLLKSFVQIKPYPTLDGFKTILDDLAKRVPAAKTANLKEFVDTRFIEERDKSGYIDGLYK